MTDRDRSRDDRYRYDDRNNDRYYDRNRDYRNDDGGRYGGPLGRLADGGDANDNSGYGYGRSYYGGWGYRGWGRPFLGLFGWGWGPHAGRGPRNFKRSDERLYEEVNDRLGDDRDLDATGIDVSVRDGEITLIGTVKDRQQKRLAEDVAGSVSGVNDVHNRLTIGEPSLGERIVDAITPG